VQLLICLSSCVVQLLCSVVLWAFVYLVDLFSCHFFVAVLLLLLLLLFLLFLLFLLLLFCRCVCSEGLRQCVHHLDAVEPVVVLFVMTASGVYITKTYTLRELQEIIR
jgi:hypothetical protein